MKKIYLIVVFALLSNGCSMMMPNIPKSIVKEMFDEVDRNHSGYFTQKEYAKDYRIDDPEGLKEEAKRKGMSEEEFLQWSFKKLDSNGDGKVRFDEFYEVVNGNKSFD